MNHEQYRNRSVSEGEVHYTSCNRYDYCSDVHDICDKINDTSLVKLTESTFEENCRTLFDACKNNDLQIVKCLLEMGYDVNSSDNFGRKSTPLHFASGFGRKEMVEFLIAQGANVAIKDEGGCFHIYNGMLGVNLYP